MHELSIQKSWSNQFAERSLTSLQEQLGTSSTSTSGPTVILVTGVNGSGKTTSIAKLTRRFTEAGLRVVLGAGDTFRAAAVEQLIDVGRSSRGRNCAR